MVNNNIFWHAQRVLSGRVFFIEKNSLVKSNKREIYLDYSLKQEYNITYKIKCLKDVKMDNNKLINKELRLRLRDKLLPMFVFPAVVGILTGILIFIFKITSSHVMHATADIYGFVRENPVYLPFLVLGVVGIGIIAARLLSLAKDCRGGGIPTAVASIRGIIPMRWAQGVFALFASAILTYIAGVPLGNEGPSVQMGAATGKGATGIFGKRNRAWERYNMTGGACAGFAIATGAPLSGIVFAMEEAHRRFSPTIFMVASVSVISGTVTSELLSVAFGVKSLFFDLAIDKVLPIKYLWVAVIIGMLSGICANLFTKVYHFIRKHSKAYSRKVSFTANFAIIFGVVALLGFISGDFIGSGHSVIDNILEGHSVWYMILLAIIIRSFVMMWANVSGVTGGLFIPTLAFGAMIASLVADGLIALGLVDAQYYAIFIVVGMASFLSSSSRIPLTALSFAAEALCVANNILPAVVGVVVAYLVAELTGKTSFADTVIEAKAHDIRAGRRPMVVDTHMLVQPDAFAIGMEIRDILWPPTCTVLSVHKKGSATDHHAGRISEGDLLHLHYQTYDMRESVQLLTYILGEQPEDDFVRIHEGDDKHLVPSE